MINVYRIGKNKYIKDLSGEGARLYGGRWNYTGYRVLYASESLALAILEYITKTGAVETELKDLSIAYLEIEDGVSISEIKIEGLPENWNNYPVPEDLKKYNAIGICAQLESEMQELPEQERAQFRAEMEIKETPLKRLIEESYRLLNLVTFFTLERKKLRAWTLEEGRSVREAAGRIHSDMEKGFIKAEVINYSDLIRIGSLFSSEARKQGSRVKREAFLSQAREKGLLKIEGKGYKVREGDIITIKFRV